jgi:hypothetical protein
MNCPKCKAPIDEVSQECASCKSGISTASEKSKVPGRTSKIAKAIFLWCVVCPVIIMIFGAGFYLFVDKFCVIRCPTGNAVSSRGKDIYVAIIGANTEREPLGFGPVWPKTCQASTNYPGDISSMVFTNSSDYFYELYDGANAGREQHDPYVRGFDYSKLAGAGVPAKVGGGKLTAENNMWAIAANITEEDADIIPVLITRNVDVKALEYIINHGGPTSNLDTRITLGAGPYKKPFGDKGFVMVRKGGGTFSNTAKYATLKFLFNSETLPPRDPSKPPIVYLMP